MSVSLDGFRMTRTSTL